MSFIMSVCLYMKFDPLPTSERVHNGGSLFSCTCRLKFLYTQMAMNENRQLRLNHYYSALQNPRVNTLEQL